MPRPVPVTPVPEPVPVPGLSWLRRSQAALCIAALLLSSPAAAQAPIVIKMASLVPAGSEWHNVLLQMADEWKKASGGRVVLRIYPGQTMGDDSDVVRKMKLGSLQAALVASLGDVEASVYALQIPMLYSNGEEVDYVRSRLEPRLDAALAAKGLVVLNWTEGGWIHFFTKTPVLHPQELRKHKLFAWAADANVLETWRASGFTPVPLPSTEISTALQTDLITAVPTTPQAAVLLQWYSHVKNMTGVRWAPLLGATIITKKAWEGIPAELRPALLASSRNAGLRLREISRRNEVRDIESMRKRGLNVVRVDAAVEAEWRRAAENAYPKIRGVVIPADVFDAARKHVAEYRQRRPAP